MNRFRIFLLILAMFAPSLAAAQQSMKFEEAATLLGASCGKDIDDNCRGVNLDADPPEGMPGPQPGRGVGQMPGRFSARPSAPSSSALPRAPSLVKLCNWEMNHLCGEVRADPAKGCNACSNSTKKATPNCNKAISAAGYR